MAINSFFMISDTLIKSSEMRVLAENLGTVEAERFIFWAVGHRSGII